MDSFLNDDVPNPPETALTDFLAMLPAFFAALPAISVASLILSLTESTALLTFASTFSFFLSAED